MRFCCFWRWQSFSLINMAAASRFLDVEAVAGIWCAGRLDGLKKEKGERGKMNFWTLFKGGSVKYDREKEGRENL